MFALLLCIFALPRLDPHGDTLPEGSVARLGTGRLRAEDSMLAAAFSPDGKTLATSCRLGSISFWEVPGFGLRLRVSLDKGRASVLAFAPDGKRLYAVTESAIHAFDPTTGSERLSMREPTTGLDGTRMALSPDGSRLLAWPQNQGEPLLFDLATGKALRRLPDVSDSSGASVAFLPDGKSMVAAQEWGRLALVRTETGRTIRSLEPDLPSGHRSRFRRSPLVAAVAPDGSRFVHRPIESEEIQVRELPTGRLLRKFASGAGRRGAGKLAFASNGRLLVEAGGDAIRVYGFASGKILRELPVTSGRDFSLSPDGKWLAHPTGHAVLVWDLTTGRLVPGCIGHDRPAISLAFVEKGCLATVDSQGWRTWNALTGKLLAHHGGVPVPQGSVRSVQAGTALEFAADDRTLHRWRVGENRTQALTAVPRGAMLGPSRWAVSPDGRLIAGLSRSGQNGVSRFVSVSLAEGATERKLAEFTGSTPGRPVFSLDGKSLAVAHHGPAVSLFDAASGERRDFRWHAESPEEFESARLAFSPDGHSLAVAAAEVRVMETATVGERFRVPGCGAGVCRPAWSGDGRLLALGTADGFAIVLDALTGEEIFRSRGKQGSVESVALRADGRRLATAGADTTILVWEVPPPKRPAITGSAEEAWEALRSGDARRAFQGMARLAAEPSALRRLASTRVAAPQTTPKRLEALARQLSEERFALRVAAQRELASLGEAARPALEKAKASGDLEAKRAAEALLGLLRDAPVAERLRRRRVAEILGKPYLLPPALRSSK